MEFFDWMTAHLSFKYGCPYAPSWCQISSLTIFAYTLVDSSTGDHWCLKNSRLPFGSVTLSWLLVFVGNKPAPTVAHVDTPRNLDRKYLSHPLPCQSHTTSVVFSTCSQIECFNHEIRCDIHFYCGRAIGCHWFPYPCGAQGTCPIKKFWALCRGQRFSGIQEGDCSWWWWFLWMAYLAIS